MGLFGGSKTCPLCGNKMPLFGNAKMSDATLCATCKGQEFSGDMQLYEFYRPMPFSALDGYRAYPDLTDIPPELQGQYDIHFGKLQELRNIGVVDREAYKNYPDNNIANKKLRHVLRKKYGLR